MADKAFQVIQGRKQPPGWKELSCEMTLGELVDFQQYMRCIILRISGIQAAGNTCPWFDVLEGIERELVTALAPYGLLFAECTEQMSITSRLLNHICRIPPVRENHEMLKGFFACLLQRERELGRPHLVRSKLANAPTCKRQPW